MGGGDEGSQLAARYCLVEGSLTDWALTLCPMHLDESLALSGPQCSPLGNGDKNNNNNRSNDTLPHRVVVRLK